MSYYTLNFAEALFWIFLGLWGYVVISAKGVRFAKFATYSSWVLVAFGLSDLAEIFYGSFLEPNLFWLFLWKIVNVAAIIFALVGYIFLRVDNAKV